MAMGGGISTAAVVATEFAGNGNKIKKVSGIFMNQLWGQPNTNAWWNDFTYRIIYYPNSAAFVADPFATGGNHGIIKTQLPAPTNITHPFEVGYLINYKQHRLEFDISSANITTTNNSTHLIAILPITKLGSGVSGITMCGFSTGNGGSVGAGNGWWRSNASSNGPATFSSLNLPQNYTAFKVVLDDAAMPHFAVDVNHVATTLQVQNVSFAQLNFNAFTYKVNNIEYWPIVFQLILANSPFTFLTFPAADTINVHLLLDLYSGTHQFGGCTTGNTCHSTP
ncbi:hypothetical protein OAO01_09595, partial [Oligoflexia bacterium]|nr:hypothetical protein [Oligoflexia bacterium]